MAKAAPAVPVKPGRPKGAKNRLPMRLQEMIEQALADQDGGPVAYFSRQAVENPTAFLALVGKLLPKQITGEGGGPVQVAFPAEVVIRAVHAKRDD